MIRSHILTITPIGISIEDVIETIENKDDWGEPRIRLTRGFHVPTTPFAGWPMVDGELQIPIIGDKHVRVDMDNYRNWFVFLVMDTTVFWGFDGDGKLIEIHVRKVGGG
jgi:hypothetical protein